MVFRCSMAKLSKKRPIASVIMATYYAERRIDKVLDCLLNQDFPREKWELIIIDDASTDDTVKRIRARIHNYPNVILIVHKVNTRQGGARNSGVAKAQGTYLFFTDDDCFVPHDWVSKGVDHFESEQEDVAAIQGDVHIPKHSYLADCISYIGFPAGGNLGFRKVFWVDKNNFTDSIITANTIVRKSMLDELDGPFDDDERLRHVEDKDLGLRLLARGYKIRYCDDLTVIHMPMPGLKSYFKRMYLKGTNGMHIVRKHPTQQEHYAKIRAKSILNVLKSTPLKYTPCVVALLTIGYGYASFCYLREKRRINQK